MHFSAAGAQPAAWGPTRPLTGNCESIEYHTPVCGGPDRVCRTVHRLRAWLSVPKTRNAQVTSGCGIAASRSGARLPVLGWAEKRLQVMEPVVEKLGAVLKELAEEQDPRTYRTTVTRRASWRAPASRRTKYTPAAARSPPSPRPSQIDEWSPGPRTMLSSSRTKRPVTS